MDRPWMDAGLTTDERVALLLGEMTLEEKAGQLFHAMIVMGPLDEPNDAFGLPAASDYLAQ
ncbi:MAG: hypothetical protein QM607_12570, partial [Microbacterium sp.]